MERNVLAGGRKMLSTIAEVIRDLLIRRRDRRPASRSRRSGLEDA